MAASAIPPTMVGADGPATLDQDLEFLRSTEPPAQDEMGIGIVDLFSGCGGLTFGALEAFRRAGRPAALRLAVDAWLPALEVLADSLRIDYDRILEMDIGRLLDPDDHRAAQTIETAAGAKGGLLVAGPPCQGHSPLNNHSRHDDRRNDLYLAVAAAARVLNPDAIVIENVRGVSADKRRGMRRCVDLLKESYAVDEGNVDLNLLGAAQKRTRHVVVATRGRAFSVDGFMVEQRVAKLLRTERTVQWAIGDLRRSKAVELAGTASIPTHENRERLDWLAGNHDEVNLPNEMRPVCHQNERHSYRSMYGRLSWNAPAQTITSGFGSMGQGRFVHPDAKRMLTPREAARLQMLPDYLCLRHVRQRAAMATMIGNAAPPVLTLRLVERLIRDGLI